MKITTVVPAYKSKFLIELLASLVHQSVKPYKVIFSDDTLDSSFYNIINSEPVNSLVKHLNVSVISGPRKGAHANWIHCINCWNQETELVHLLCDDDIIYPKFYEHHLRAHLSGHFSCTISRRWYANENGQPILHSLPVPEIIANHLHRLISIDSNFLFLNTVAIGSNWLGEVSNTVMRKDTASLVASAVYDGISFSGLEDLGAFVCGSLYNPICFINEHLGYFRQSTLQNSANTKGMPLKLALLAYITLSIIGRNIGKLNPDDTSNLINLVRPIFLQHYSNDDDCRDICISLKRLSHLDEASEINFINKFHEFKLNN